MNEQQLRRAYAWFRARPARITALRAANALCTGVTVAAFGAECAALALRHDPALVRLGLTCGVPLAAIHQELIAVVRKPLNAGFAAFLPEEIGLYIVAVIHSHRCRTCVFTGM